MGFCICIMFCTYSLLYQKDIYLKETPVNKMNE